MFEDELKDKPLNDDSLFGLPDNLKTNSIDDLFAVETNEMKPVAANEKDSSLVNDPLLVLDTSNDDKKKISSENKSDQIIQEKLTDKI